MEKFLSHIYFVSIKEKVHILYNNGKLVQSSFTNISASYRYPNSTKSLSKVPQKNLKTTPPFWSNLVAKRCTYEVKELSVKFGGSSNSMKSLSKVPQKSKTMPSSWSNLAAG